MTEYYTEVTTAHGSANRYETGKIDAVRKAVLKRMKEKNGFRGYIHIKTANGWKELGHIDYDEYLSSYVWKTVFDPIKRKESEIYRLATNGTITKIKW